MPIMDVGRHTAHVTSAELGTTSTNKTQIAVGFENEDGQHITWYGYFTPAALPYTVEKLEACGWNRAATDNDICAALDSGALIGTEVRITVELETGQDGKDRHKVSWINKPGSGGVANPLDAAEAKSFAEDLRGMIIAEMGPGEPRPEEPDDPAGRPGGDDDLPF
jgi:hypothetical protein